MQGRVDAESDTVSVQSGKVVQWRDMPCSHVPAGRVPVRDDRLAGPGRGLGQLKHGRRWTPLSESTAAHQR
jgi:hypothetical protein